MTRTETDSVVAIWDPTRIVIGSDSKRITAA